MELSQTLKIKEVPNLAGGASQSGCMEDRPLYKRGY